MLDPVYHVGKFPHLAGQEESSGSLHRKSNGKSVEVNSKSL